MVSKINSTAELPSWFCLQKYELVSTFSAQDWLFELALRTVALNQIYFAKEFLRSTSDTDLQRLAEDSNPQLINLAHDFSEFIDALRDQPIRCHLEGNMLWDGMVELIALDSRDRGCVRPLTIEDLYLQKNADELALEDGIGSEAAVERWKYVTGESEVDFSRESPVHPISINRHMPNRWDEPILVIDLNIPDVLLLEAFKDWLKNQRLSPPPGLTVRRKPAYEWWSRYGLLPYIDLLIWSHQTDHHIPDRVMAEAISSFNAGEDRLRKTIKPIVSDIYSHLEGLRELAAAEGSRSRSGIF